MDTSRLEEIVAIGSILSDPILSILLVEDNPGDVVILTYLLKSTNLKFSITHAGSLKETFKWLIDKDFDLIFLDLGLPESTGLETLKKIKEFKIKCPIIVMTGLDDGDVALASLREGAQDYLVKTNLTSENLFRSIKYSIERKKSRISRKNIPISSQYFLVQRA